MGRKKHIDYLKIFKEQLSKEVAVKYMYLFGSRAGGKAGRWSDFDIIIVSDAFKNKRSFERPIGLRKYWTLDYPVDFLCYSPEEFNKLRKQISIVREAVEHGIEIK